MSRCLYCGPQLERAHFISTFLMQGKTDFLLEIPDMVTDQWAAPGLDIISTYKIL